MLKNSEQYVHCFRVHEGIETKKETTKYVRYYQTSLGMQVAEYEAKLISNVVQKNAVVLSIGCGPGIIEQRVLELRKDLSIIALDANKEMLSTIPVNLHPIHADGSYLPFSSLSFDAAICITSLEFMTHPEKTIREIHRVLIPKGLLLALLLNPQSIYVQQKINEKDSYIGSNIQQKTIKYILLYITHLFDETESYVDLPIDNNEIQENLSNDTARLVIMKARK